MASQEHVQRLKQGSWEWNRWRDEHVEVQPDLSEADLSRVPLCQANLSFADLSKANLKGANLTGANLREANLTKTILSGATLDQTTFEGATLDRTDLRGIPWLLVMALTLQPGIIWKDVLYDRPQQQGEKAQLEL